MRIRISRTYIPESLEDCDELRNGDRCGSCSHKHSLILKDREYTKKHGCTYRKWNIEDNRSWLSPCTAFCGVRYKEEK